MNFNYDSYLSEVPPTTPTMVARAQAAISRSPWKVYSDSHNDIMRSQGMENAALYGLASSKANTDFDLQAQQARNQLALGGLQMLTQDQQNQANLANSRLGMATGLYNSLLSGLYG